MCAKVQERFFGQMHQPIDLFFWALEVVDGKGIYRHEFDVEAVTYFQNLVLMNQDFLQRGTCVCVAYPPQRDEAVDVSLYNLHAFDTGIPSITIHDEGNMLRYRACSKNGKQGTTDVVKDGHGNGLVAGWRSHS